MILLKNNSVIHFVNVGPGVDYYVYNAFPDEHGVSELSLHDDTLNPLNLFHHSST